MKITTLLLSVTACVFAAGYVIFAPRTNDVPARAQLETPLENDADTGKPAKAAAVPAAAKEVRAAPVQQAQAVKKNQDVAVGKDASKQQAIQKRPSAKAEQTASPKPAPPPPVTAKEAPKDASPAFTVPPGHQAVTVERTPEFLPGPHTYVGSRVNVLATTRDEDGKPQSKVMLRDVLVLAEDHTKVDEKSIRCLITLAVAKEDLPVIQEARRLGPVSIMTKLFRPEENGPPAPQAPNGVVIIVTESPSLPVIITGSPNTPTISNGPSIITESRNLPKVIEGPR